MRQRPESGSLGGQKAPGRSAATRKAATRKAAARKRSGGNTASAARLRGALLATLVGLLAAGVPPTRASAQEDDTLEAKREAQAAKLYAEGSYALAYELYAVVDTAALAPLQAARVEFRRADSLWRSLGREARRSEAKKVEEARKTLDALRYRLGKPTGAQEVTEERFELRAEVLEALGDFYRHPWFGRDLGNAWNYYQEGLDFWAGARDVERARARYLRLIWKATTDARAEARFRFAFGIPREYLENARDIAVVDEDRARAQFLIARSLSEDQGTPYQARQARLACEAAVESSATSEWHDDALFHYAGFLSSRGSVRYSDSEDDGWVVEADYPGAVAAYRRLLELFPKGKSAHHNRAKRRLKSILGPSVRIHTTPAFQPGHPAATEFTWRNVPRVELKLFALDLTRDVKPSGDDWRTRRWLEHVDVSWRKPERSWSEETGDTGDHRPGQRKLELAASGTPLAPGAYLLEARAGETSSRELVLVSDVVVVFKSSVDQALVYVCDANDGSPISGAEVTLWERPRRNGKALRWRQHTAATDAKGTAIFATGDGNRNRSYFVSARKGDRQAFARNTAYGRSPTNGEWRILAYTDRPAYRPGNSVHWKVVARVRSGGEYSTPANASIDYAISDPRGNELRKGSLRLGKFGGAWDSFDLGADLPLGEYQVAFWTPGRKRQLGGATLFRIEEYKLPDFEVTVHVPEEDGKKKTFLLGDRVESEIRARYYFGAPVTDGEVEVLVYRRQFHRWRTPRREYPWLFDDSDSRWHGGGPGEIVLQKTLTLDAEGRATIVLETESSSESDLEYRVEARVTDASRREIVGTGTVRVTREEYYADLETSNHVYAPRDKVNVELETEDANGEPVAGKGRIRVTREEWTEIWIDPTGKPFSAADSHAARTANPIGWRLDFQGYRSEEILAQALATTKDGRADFDFTPERTGYYRIAWQSSPRDDRPLPPVQAEATVWVSTDAASDLGYRHSGVEIIVDKDSVRVGEKTPVLLVTDAPGRHVLFTVDGASLESYEVLHMNGRTKLIHVDIEEKHSPNFFLTAALVAERELHVDEKRVVAPPERNFLDVAVTSDAAEYEPGQEATITVTTRDSDGEPVAAEVGLALVDEAIFYIQKPYAPDPRQFFFGRTRSQRLSTQSTLQQKRYRTRTELHSVSPKYGQARTATGSSDVVLRDQFMARPTAMAAGRGSALGFAAESDEALSRLEEGSADAAFDGEDSPEADPTVQVRSDFRATAVWQPDVVTDSSGSAQVKVSLPDSVTRWKATARAATAGNQVGTSVATVRTRRPLIVRLEGPRFFLVGDTPTVSAIIHNNTDAAVTVTPKLEAKGLVVEGVVPPGGEPLGPVEAGPRQVPAEGIVRIDWRVTVKSPGDENPTRGPFSSPVPGTARVQVSVRSAAHADAVARDYPVYEHGIEKFLAGAGTLRGSESLVTLDLPNARRSGSTRLGVQVAPSIAVTLLDALPYLVDYPYGCTEQTLSRFLPAVITFKTLRDLGLDPEKIAARTFGGIETEHVDKTHPKGKQDLAKLDDMIAKGLERLYDFQHGDGGWGWWKKGDSDNFMSGYVLWGLSLARAAGVDVEGRVLSSAAEFLNNQLVEAENQPDLLAWLTHALTTYRASSKDAVATPHLGAALDRLWGQRDQLNAYSRALFALASHTHGEADRSRILVRNLYNGVKRDRRPDQSVLLPPGAQPTEDTGATGGGGAGGGADPATTAGAAHWGEAGLHWRWSDGGVEATAFALRALMAIDPKHELVEPVMTWLVKNRRGTQWKSTRDTAIVILALGDYLQKSGELESGLEYELEVNGHSVVRQKVTAADILSAPTRFDVAAEHIRDGKNEIRLRRIGGEGVAYLSAQATFFSEEEPILAAGNELFVRRDYFRLVGRQTLLKGLVYDRIPLRDGETAISGERIEVALRIETKNDAEYLLFEDLKPAGFEAVEVRSGTGLYAHELHREGIQDELKKASSGVAIPPDRRDRGTRRSRGVYHEVRDRKVALFVDRLPQGIWEIRYALRAEVPGSFHALPALGEAMYVPEIRANSDEVRFDVRDAGNGKIAGR